MNHETETALKQIDTNLELLKIHMRKMEEFDKYGQAHLTAEENAMFLKALEYITETGNFIHTLIDIVSKLWARQFLVHCRYQQMVILVFGTILPTTNPMKFQWVILWMPTYPT